jgi:hypothetical protein
MPTFDSLRGLLLEEVTRKGKKIGPGVEDILVGELAHIAR